eukprot:2093743-Prymnesium_polylepis.1
MKRLACLHFPPQARRRRRSAGRRVTMRVTLSKLCLSSHLPDRSAMCLDSRTYLLAGEDGFS